MPHRDPKKPNPSPSGMPPDPPARTVNLPTSPVRHLTATSPQLVASGLSPQDRPILFVLQGREQGAVVPISAERLLVGREVSADVSLTDDTVSREHAQLRCEGGQIYLEDLASLNGTYVNERRLTGRVRLESGDRVRFGDNTIVKFARVDELEERALRTLFELAARDPLTRLYNRRYFDDRLNSELAFSRRHGTPVALLLVDIDHFKHVNDSYGHPQGDTVLKAVAAGLQASLRPEDVLSRFGGEEFVVIARNISRESAESFGQRIRWAIERLVLPEPALKVTVSVGVACVPPGLSLRDPEALVAAADEALYRAKAAGRNCVRVATVTPELAAARAICDTVPPSSGSQALL